MGFSADRRPIYGLGRAPGLSSAANAPRSDGLPLPGPDDVTTLQAMSGDVQAWYERP